MNKPDAQRLHDRHSGPRLVEQAQRKVGSQKALAAMVGLSCESLRLIANGTHDIKYSMQYLLEVVTHE